TGQKQAVAATCFPPTDEGEVKRGLSESRPSEWLTVCKRRKNAICSLREKAFRNITMKQAFPVHCGEKSLEMLMTYRGGCHCGRIAFEAEGALESVTQCNCSICAKKAYLHWIIPRETFRLLTTGENLTTYSFNTGVAKHRFCPVCGVAPFYIPRSDPDKI